MTKFFSAFFFAVLFSIAACTPSQPSAPQQEQAETPTVGADQDTHGCKASAGYQWSVVKNQCIRIFESGIRLDAEAYGLDKHLSAFVVFKSDETQGQAELFLPAQEGSLLMEQVADDGAGTWKVDTFTLLQWRGMMTLQGKSGTTLYQGPLAR